MGISQLINKNGKAVANQFIIKEGNKISFQSYESMICEYEESTKTLKLFGKVWDHSNTTRNHFKTFINNFTCYEYINIKQFKEIAETFSNIVKI